MTTDSTTVHALDRSKVAGVHQGGCHCGAVRFEVDFDPGKGATRCNCSICVKTATTGVIVKPEAFRLLSGEDALSTYEWGHKVSRRYFCKHCGIHCFGRGHLDVLGGDFVSLAVNCLDDVDLSELSILHWDGRHDNWYVGPRPEPWPIFTASNATPSGAT